MKTAYAGAGLALMAGLLMGGAMKPDLGANDRPEGPQIVAAWDGGKSTGPFDSDAGLAFAAYKGKIPDYVLGSDWVRPASAQAAPLPRAAAVDDYHYGQAEMAPMEIQTAEAHATPAIARADSTTALYGSDAAERAYSDAMRAEKTPQATPAVFDDEVAPEATGDTSRAN